MKNNTLGHEKKTQNILFWGVCSILFLPIIILPPSFQPSEWTRTTLFRILITALVTFVLFKYFYKNDISISLPKWNISKYLPFLVLLGFMLLIIISTIFSVDPRFSFFGNPSRAGGSLNLLFYFGFTVFLTLFIKDTNWEKLLKINFVVAFLASLFALTQAFNLFKNTFISYEGGGAPSVFGNSTFFAIYMLFITIWSFVLLIQKKDKKQKMLYGGLFCFFVLTIFLTDSRATYLALIVSFFYFLFFYPFKIKKIKTLKIIAGSILIFAAITVLVFNSFPQLADQNIIFFKLENRLSIERVAEDLFGTRFAVWQMTIEAIKDKPLFGWGPENFYVGFEKYFEPTAPNMQKLWWDRPHNVFLEIAVNYGLIALFFYISFWIILLWNLQKFKLAKKNADANPDETLVAHGLQAMIIGYLITLFFNFDSFPTYLISFFFIGYAFSLLFSQTEKTEIKNNQKIINYKNKKIITVIFYVILLLFIYFWNIKPLYINESIVFAKNLSNVGSCEKSLSIIENANENPGILKVYNALTYSDIIKKCSNKEQQIEQAKKGVEALKEAVVIQPNYTRAWLFMGALTNVLAANEQDSGNKDDLLKEARDYFNKALELSPKRQEILVELEKNYLIAQNYKEMEKTGHNCINIDSTQGICYWYLGISEIFMGNQENGKKHIEKSLELGGFPIPWLQLGAAYVDQKNYKDAADAYYMITVSYPENASYHAVYAFLLKENGEYNKAASEALKVFQLQPGNKDSQDFLEALLGTSPNDPIVHASLAYMYKELGENEKFLKELNTAKLIYLQLIAQNPNNATLHFQLAGVYAELNNYENSYQEALLAINLADHPNTKEQIENYIWNRLPREFGTKYFEMKEKLK
jgi:O-antigen ligase/tetratricopeptide (TPR) repeat protein